LLNYITDQWSFQGLLRDEIRDWYFLLRDVICDRVFQLKAKRSKTPEKNRGLSIVGGGGGNCT